MGFSLTRQAFYELLWSEPRTSLAKRFGVSDSMIGKTARKAKIPSPGKGYWQKIKNGKKVIAPPLPQRLPGASDLIHFGDHWQYARVELDDNEIPVAPVFDENLEQLRARVTEVVGKVPYPTIAKATHSITSRLLDQDSDRRKAMEANRYTWDEPKFDSPIEKRRLRIFNALFLKLQALECKPSMSNSKYDDYIEASFLVGDQHVHTVLETVIPKPRARSKTIRKPYLMFTVKVGSNTSDNLEWHDQDDSKLEDHLTSIVIELIVTGEHKYRKSSQWQYERKIQEREARIAKETQRIIDEERLTLELKEKETKARIDHLLNQAESLRKAEVIRDYVDTILSRADEIDKPASEIHDWAVWAKEQADNIDPIVNFRGIFDTR